MSPGLRYTATQGGGNAYYGFTPTVLRHIRAHTVWENLRNSVGVEKREGETLLTQGSGVPQPWAMLWNPVGILNTYGGISAPFSLGPRPLKFCGSRDCHKRAKRDGTVPALRTVSTGSVHTTISLGFASGVYATPAKKRDSHRRDSRLCTPFLTSAHALEAVSFFALSAFSTLFPRNLSLPYIYLSFILSAGSVHTTISPGFAGGVYACSKRWFPGLFRIALSKCRHFRVTQEAVKMVRVH